MVVYGAADAALAYLIKPIIDDVLPPRAIWCSSPPRIVVAYFAQGPRRVLFQLPDGRARPSRRDGRAQPAVPAHAGSVGGVLCPPRDRASCCRASTTTSAWCSARYRKRSAISPRESLALLGSAALLFYYDAKLAIVCMTATPLIVYPLVRLGNRVRTVTRWSQEAQEHMSHVAGRGLRRPSHRQGLRRRGARSHEVRRARRASLFRTNLKVTRVLAHAAAVDGVLGGFGDRRRALWYGTREIAIGRLTAGEFTSFLAALLFMYAPIKKLSRVNANLQQAVAASERIFEIARHAHRGARTAGRDRRCRRSPRRSSSATSASATRTATAATRCAASRSPFAPARWSRSSAAAAPARRRWSTCCRASTT